MENCCALISGCSTLLSILFYPQRLALLLQRQLHSSNSPASLLPMSILVDVHIRRATAWIMIFLPPCSFSSEKLTELTVKIFEWFSSKVTFPLRGRKKGILTSVNKNKWKEDDFIFSSSFYTSNMEKSEEVNTAYDSITSLAFPFLLNLKWIQTDSGPFTYY